MLPSRATPLLCQASRHAIYSKEMVVSINGFCYTLGATNLQAGAGGAVHCQIPQTGGNGSG
ncbi:hypothetical protein NKDENANG_02148 [Candidatus Entotheonellaceae bacterium PAL068K]